jgi:hypothetical protein
MIDIYIYGKYEEGLTGEEIKFYISERYNEQQGFNVIKTFTNPILKKLERKFNKIAGCNTMSCKMINGKLTPLMFRHDVERFCGVLFENKSTYFD